MAWVREKRAWYADGLAFECLECGGCCSGPEEGYVWITRPEIAVAAGYLDVPVEQFMQRYTRRIGSRISLVEKSNFDCVFLDPPDTDGNGPKRCSVYAVRPMQCRTWPFWPSNLRSQRAWSLAATRCPGINRGKLHEANHIENEKARTR